MRRPDRVMLSIASIAMTLQVGGSVAWAAEPDDAFTASSGLFELEVPTGWIAAEHADGGGVLLTASSGDAAVDITFIPRSVLHSGGLRMGAPAGAGPMAVAERIAVLIPPAEGVTAAEPALVELANAQEAVELAAVASDVEGAVYVLEPKPGVAALASATSPAGGYADVRGTALEILSSLAFVGDEDGLMELLDPPPLVEIALG